jgi:hypothetical protein
MKILKLLSATALILLISACGGGGGGSSGPATSTETFQIKTAFVNYFNSTGSLPFTVSGTSSGVSITGSGTLTGSTPVSATFESMPALQKNEAITYTLTSNGVTATDASTSSSYVDSNYQPKGESNSEYSVVTSTTAIPVTAHVGDSGTWSTANRYTTSAKTSLLGTSTTSYVLEADTASTALLKTISEDKDRSGATTVTTISTYRITPAGAITRISVSVTKSPLFLTYTF